MTDLPIDLDHVSPGDLEHRVRSLALDDVRRLIEHERAHAGRPQVLLVLEERVRQLEAGATPTSGTPDGGLSAPAPDGRGPVSPDTAVPGAPTIPHGDPTNPSQPRT